MKTLLFTCALLLLTANGADALRRVRPIHVRMDAYIGAKPDGVSHEFLWPVGYKGKRYPLYVVSLVVVGGNVTALSIDSAVAPYQVKFQLAGEKSAMQRFISTPPNQRVTIAGYLRLDPAGRFMMVDTVEPAAPATPVGTSGN